MANWTGESAIPRSDYSCTQCDSQSGGPWLPLSRAETATSPAGVSISLSELRKAAEQYQELVDKLRMTLAAITLPEPPTAQCVSNQRPVPLRSSLAGGLSEIAQQIERSNAVLAAILGRIDL